MTEKKIKVLPFTFYNEEGSLSFDNIDNNGVFYLSGKQCVYNLKEIDTDEGKGLFVTVAKSRYTNIPAISNNEMEISNISLNQDYEEEFSDIYYIYINTEKLYGFTFALVGRSPLNVAYGFLGNIFDNVSASRMLKRNMLEEIKEADLITKIDFTFRHDMPYSYQQNKILDLMPETVSYSLNNKNGLNKNNVLSMINELIDDAQTLKVKAIYDRSSREYNLKSMHLEYSTIISFEGSMLDEDSFIKHVNDINFNLHNDGFIN